MEVSVVIPNYNGIAFLDSVLASLEGQTLKNFEVIFVDNGSSDGSCSFVAGNYPWVHIIELPENYGFCKAVNEGIKASRAPYVLLLNNDTEVKEDFLEEMVAAIRRHKRAFSCAARMVQYHDRDRLDDAGNFYNALGWSFARGKGRDIHTYEKEEQIFSSCGGAAIYRRKLFEKIGYFDEEHFAYLEDTDIGYRARIYGYENWYAPKAIVYHVGSGTSGSRYISFQDQIFFKKQRLSDLQKYAAASDYSESSVPGSRIFDQVFVFCCQGHGQRISGRYQEWIFHQPQGSKSPVFDETSAKLCQDSAGIMEEYFCQIYCVKADLQTAELNFIK